MTILYQFLTRDEDIYLTGAASDIIRRYGFDHQVVKLEEEVGELISAKARYDNDESKENAEHMAEELADVILVLEQLVGSLNAKEGRKLAEIVMAKADRQLRRISAEQDAAAHRDIEHGC